MKRLFLFLLLIPTILYAQEDAKYMIGAVPIVEGKVVFTREVNLPGQSKEQIFAAALKWASGRFVADKELQSRVLFSDPGSGQIACLGQEFLVFTNKALSLDRAIINYQMFLECLPGKCNLKILAIRYVYNTGGNNEIIAAEEQITDEYTLNKKKDKLIKATGKFRTHTIDLTDELFVGATKALGGNTTVLQLVAALPATPVNPANTVVWIPASGAGVLAGYKQITPDKIPGNIYKMLSDSWMLITAGNDSQFNMMTASWGGLGHLYNKPVAFCFINPTRHTFQLMENNDTYTLSFYNETYRDALNYCGSHSGKNDDKVKGSDLTPLTTPSGSKAFSEAWMIIECKKMVAQQFSLEAIYDTEAKAKWGKDLHKMFIGEIINVWVK